MHKSLIFFSSFFAARSLNCSGQQCYSKCKSKNPDPSREIFNNFDKNPTLPQRKNPERFCSRNALARFRFQT